MSRTGVYTVYFSFIDVFFRTPLRSQSRQSAKLFFQSSELGLPVPNPSLADERGAGRVQIPTTGEKASEEGTCTVVLFIYTYFVVVTCLFFNVTRHARVQGSLIAHSPNCPLASMDSEFDIIPGLRYTQRISFSNCPAHLPELLKFFPRVSFPAIYKVPGLFRQLLEFSKAFYLKVFGIFWISSKIPSFLDLFSFPSFSFPGFICTLYNVSRTFTWSTPYFPRFY